MKIVYKFSAILLAWPTAGTCLVELEFSSRPLMRIWNSRNEIFGKISQKIKLRAEREEPQCNVFLVNAD